MFMDTINFLNTVIGGFQGLTKNWGILKTCLEFMNFKTLRGIDGF